MQEIQEQKNCFFEDKEKMQKLTAVLKESGIQVFEYYPEEDTIIVYDDLLKDGKAIPEYLSYLEKETRVHPEDRWKAVEFYKERLRGPIELRTIGEDGRIHKKVVEASVVQDKKTGKRMLFGNAKDISADKQREEILEEQAKRDPLTRLYNNISGREVISEYLINKNPYSSCGMMVVDIDCFKNINDTYGHLAGDRVLVDMAELLVSMFDEKDILVRTGGDEFVIFLKDISHITLTKKANMLVETVRKIKVAENYVMTCSVGVCFLEENISGYTYDQMFENADWALYRAKERGKNGFVFCDNLQRFLFKENAEKKSSANIDIRYLQNDIISTAFEIFDKMNSFEAAIKLLLEVVGIRLQLDRITVIQTDIKKKGTGKQYMWKKPEIPEVLEKPASFEKEDFLTLFHSYDEYGTTVLQHDNMSMYSEGAQQLLMQGGAKTVLYAAMYCEGQYTGAISFVTCEEKRYWTKKERSQLGELTKLVSAYLSKNKAINGIYHSNISVPEYDYLTGLPSFARFREEVERVIVGGNATSHALMYVDFENFKYFNQKQGYSAGDQILKEFSQFVIGRLEEGENIYFSRVVADQFVLFEPIDAESNIVNIISEANQQFIQRYAEKYPDMKLRLRTGIYRIPSDCISASAAIDSANYARRQIKRTMSETALLYDKEMEKRQTLDNEIVYGMEKAMEKGEFEVWLQPRFSLNTREILGAEALIRWQRSDGVRLYPDSFIPLYEKNGKIVELDFYVFERVAAYQAERKKRGKKEIPISINASILHAADKGTAARYCEILKKYEVKPELMEIELTETATVSDYANVKELFRSLQEAGMCTVLDDFGAGYSVLNTVIDIPINTVKLDMEFINTCEATERGIFFLKQIIQLVKGLGYHVVCEGIETEEQANIMIDADCDEAQGFLFSKVLPMEEFDKMI